jgi:hypothetical protein
MYLLEAKDGGNLRDGANNFEWPGKIGQGRRAFAGRVKYRESGGRIIFGTGFADFRLSCISFKISA